MKSTIDNAGRVVIPKAVRDAAGITPGVPLDIEYRDGKIEIEPKSTPARLIRKSGVVVATFPGARKISVKETNEWIRKSRDREI